MKYFGIGISLVAANFAYQFFGAENWPLAFDRSWFQVCAVAACWITSALFPSGDSGDTA